jgi:tRNA G18 (ribose-2'-O)-methylase SpoU
LLQWRPRLKWRHTAPDVAASSSGSDSHGYMSPLQISHNEDSWRLHGLKIVLVAPKGEQNVGAVARVCANFEVRALVLQKPYQRMWHAACQCVCRALLLVVIARFPKPASCDV